MHKWRSALKSAFFVEAKDGIRDSPVPGVQTCPLPICHASPHGQTRRQQHPHRDSLPVQPAPTTGLRIHVGSRSDRGFEHEKRRVKRDHRRSADGPETLDDRFSFCLDGGQTDPLPHTSRVLAILTVLPPESPHDYLNRRDRKSTRLNSSHW